MEERRGSRRAEMKLSARWETPAGFHTAVVLNGSRGGCFVQTQTDEPDDVPLKIEIELPRGEWIAVWGEVAYYLPTEGFGLQFIENPDEGVGPALAKWVEHLNSLKEVSPPCLPQSRMTTSPSTTRAR